MNTDNNKYGRQQNIPGEDAHDQNQRHPDWDNDHRKKDPKYEEKRVKNQVASHSKFEDNNLKSEASGDSTHPDHKKDSQTNQSEDPTRKNEANQGASDLRTRERTSFKREGESKEENE